MSDIIKGQTLLVTGGTGSFGQSFVREVLRYEPKSIRVYSRGEYGQQQMATKFPNTLIRFVIGDVRDKERLGALMKDVDIVIHAAALKQIPSCEYNPTEAIKTNVLGSVNVVECAIVNKVKRVLAISTDKAVQPVNIYGATKLCMEKLFKDANRFSKPVLFSCLRLGNVLNSRGSVTEIWQSQEESGVIKLTEREMTRFWLTQEEAAKFAVRMLGLMQGGEIFIPKMPYKTVEKLASELHPGIPLKVIGNRGAEKLGELLWSEVEKPIEHDDYWEIK